MGCFGRREGEKRGFAEEKSAAWERCGRGDEESVACQRGRFEFEMFWECGGWCEGGEGG